MSIVRFQKIFIPTALHKSLEILKVERSQGSNVKGKYQAKLESQEGWGEEAQTKNLYMGRVMDISGTTHYTYRRSH